MPISAIGAVSAQDNVMMAQQGSRSASIKAGAGPDSATHAGATSAPTEVLSDRLKAMKDQKFSAGSAVAEANGMGTPIGNEGDLPAVEGFSSIPNAPSNGGEVGGPSYLMEKVLEMVQKEGANALLAQANQLPSGAVSHSTH